MCTPVHTSVHETFFGVNEIFRVHETHLEITKKYIELD